MRINLFTRKKISGLLIISLLFIPFSCKQTMGETSGLVGFQYFKVQDTTRLYQYNEDTIFRPMLIYFWYPSNEKDIPEQMSFKQYVDLISIREDFSKEEDIINQESFNFVDGYLGFAKASYKIGLNTDANKILNSPVNAHMDIPVAKGKFPLIIYSPSNGKTPVQNLVICEELAKQGFYVISVASAGKNSIQRKDTQESILAQVEDMEFILNYMEENIKIKYSRIGLLGFSTGGLANSIFQMRNQKVEAVCCLDGSQEYAHYIFLSKLKDFDLNNTNKPYLLFANKDVISIYPYYNSIHTTNKYFYRMPQIGHFGFVSFWTFIDSCDSDSLQNYYTSSYQSIMNTSSSFFNAYLKESTNCKTNFLKSTSQDNVFIKQEDMNNTLVTNLLNNYLNSSIDSALSHYIGYKQDAKNKTVQSEKELSLLGRMLLDYDKMAATKIFQINNIEYPDTWQTYVDLGHVYKLAGDNYKAREILLRGQVLYPENKEIKELLFSLSN